MNELWSPSQISVAFTTYPREPRYLGQSMASFALGDARAREFRSIAVAVDADDLGYVEDLKQHTGIRWLARTAEESTRVADFAVHRRACHNYWRAMGMGAPGIRGLLVCEDDIVFREGWVGMLMQVLDEMTAAGLSEMIVNLGSFRNPDEQHRRRGEFYSSFPAPAFHGTQAILYTAGEVEPVRDIVWRCGVERPEAPYDLLVKRRAIDRQHLYASRFAIVQHTGFQSTGLGGGGARTASFYRPWPGQEEKARETAREDRVLVGICSSHVHAERREAVRKTWLPLCKGQVEARFFVGTGVVDEADTVVLNAPDDYDYLPAKVGAFFRYALEHFKFDWLFKCDDDTYLMPERLLSLLGTHDVVGNDFLAARGSASGGAGYLLSRKAVEALVADDSLAATGPEDVIFTGALVQRGWSWAATPRLCFDARRVPTLSNNMVTCHWISPARMLAIHAGLFDSAVEEVKLQHPCWSDSVVLYASGLFSRKSCGDSGRWTRNEDGALLLEWFDWGPERFCPVDGGRGYYFAGAVQ